VNIFTTSVFLETAGELYFPTRRRSIEVCRLEGRRLPMLVLDGREVVGAMNFYDFPQPLDDAKGPIDREILWLPRTVIETTTVAERVVELPRGKQHAPYIAWQTLPTFEAFEADWKSRGAVKPNDSARQRRRIEKEIGPLRFEFDDRSAEAFDACVRWKSAQYQASGYVDMFASSVNVQLFKRLQERGALLVSSLRAGSTLMAVHFGATNDRRLGSWIPAYDVALQKYSPGRLLLEDMLKASHARGDLEFDFLIGNEAYKFQFATHSRVIGEVGSPPVSHLLKTKARAQAKAFLDENPKAREWLNKVRAFRNKPTAK
jgi:CelD/BcsL family acetyltransferase involved in cellulose biosynthesis